MNKGDVLCLREDPVPLTELLEAEIEVLELLPYKPVFSRGYNAMIHMHTFADTCTIKDILEAKEKDVQSGEIMTKEKPKFVRSFAKAKVRIAFNQKVPVEKFEQLAALGRFTLRDEGKTIALGRVLKYKPASSSTANVRTAAAAKPTTTATADKSEDLVFNLETGETSKAKAQMTKIEEGDE